MIKRKITLINNRNYSVQKFRMNLIEHLKKEGYQVSLIIIDNSKKRIDIEDVDIYYINDNNRNINPLSKLFLLKKIKKILKTIKPDIVFSFQLSPNIFGSIAAKLCGINNIYSMVEGAGDVFVYSTIKWKIIRFITCLLYKQSFQYCDKVIFLNNDDKDEFLKRGLVKQEQCEIIPGVGVNTDYFAYKEMNKYNSFLTIARMMPSKGTIEFCKAAEEVKKKYPEVVFNYIGEEFTLTKKDIQKYIDNGIINYYGWQEDVRPFFEDCLAYLSFSSYREGLPMTIMEAASIGRPSIVTNNIGNKDIIIDKYNGFIVKNNHEHMVDKIIYALEHIDEMKTMGINSRKLVETKYNVHVINKIILDIIR